MSPVCPNSLPAVLSHSSERTPAVYFPPGFSSPRHSHDTPHPTSPAADNEPISDQELQDNAEIAAPEALIEKEPSLIPTEEKLNDSGTDTTGEFEKWDDHFCDPDAKLVIKSDDGIKFRASRWQLSQSS